MYKNILWVSILCLLFFSCHKSEKNNKESRSKNLPKLLDLGAHACIPCQKLEPILKELKEEYRGLLAVEFIDVWKQENKQKAALYRIESIPTQIFFDASGKELWRHEGFISKEAILEKWEELGYAF